MTNTIPQPGDKFPDFDLPIALLGDDGGSESTRSLADFAGKPLVLFVYPKDATSGCTVEAQGFRDEYAALQKTGAQVVGLSRDKMGPHRRFICKEELPYPLLSDAEQTLLRACGLIVNKTMYGKPVTKVLRTTFLIDGKGVVERVWENVKPPGHAQEVLTALRER